LFPFTFEQIEEARFAKLEMGQRINLQFVENSNKINEGDAKPILTLMVKRSTFVQIREVPPTPCVHSSRK
jgi:hypothetical protein